MFLPIDETLGERLWSLLLNEVILLLEGLAKAPEDDSKSANTHTHTDNLNSTEMCLGEKVYF